MTAPRLYRCLLAALLLSAAPAWAQLTVEPQGVAVTVEQYQAETRTLVLTNDGEEPLAFCLSFDRPLQRNGATLRLGEQGGGTACGAYGGVLGIVDEEVIPDAGSWDPYGMAMTPDGRLFVADYNRFPSRTHELTADLQLVRSFPHPVVEEVGIGTVTTGVTYNVDTGTLWWLNLESTRVNGETVILRALLLEGDLDGEPTGRRIELPVAEEGHPVGLAYDATSRWYYYTDITTETIWAVDSLGAVAPGYPVQMEAYPGATIARGLNVLPAAEPEGLRIELYINPPGPTPPRHIGVVGRYGEDTAPGAEPLETPYASDNPNTPPGVVSGEALRSVLDPNGVLYYPWSGFDGKGVVAIRPHPLPPSWLAVEAWGGTLGPGESRSVELTFRPGGRAIGDYTAVLQAFEAATGAAVEVPLTLTVTPGVDVEDSPEPEDASGLVVYPNPASGSATVALSLTKASEVRVAVYDVLGRAVAVLHDGPLGAGEHTLDFETAGLPAGLYLVRVEGGGLTEARRVTVLR